MIQNGTSGSSPRRREATAEPASSIRGASAGSVEGCPQVPRSLDRPTHLHTAEFAALLGVEPGRYRRYERAETEPPFWLLAAIRRITGASVDWLLEWIAKGELLDSGVLAA